MRKEQRNENELKTYGSRQTANIYLSCMPQTGLNKLKQAPCKEDQHRAAQQK